MMGRRPSVQHKTAPRTGDRTRQCPLGASASLRSGTTRQRVFFRCPQTASVGAPPFLELPAAMAAS